MIFSNSAILLLLYNSENLGAAIEFIANSVRLVIAESWMQAEYIPTCASVLKIPSIIVSIHPSISIRELDKSIGKDVAKSSFVVYFSCFVVCRMFEYLNQRIKLKIMEMNIPKVYDWIGVSFVLIVKNSAKNTIVRRKGDTSFRKVNSFVFLSPLSDWKFTYNNAIGNIPNALIFKYGVRDWLLNMVVAIKFADL